MGTGQRAHQAHRHYLIAILNDLAHNEKVTTADKAERVCLTDWSDIEGRSESSFTENLVCRFWSTNSFYQVNLGYVKLFESSRELREKYNLAYYAECPHCIYCTWAPYRIQAI